MRIDPSRAIGAYAAAMTVTAVWLALGAASTPAGDTRFRTIDVERINVREPDGTLRLVLASHARMPGIVIGRAEYAHPNRPEAGMIFLNDEGAENGGLIFDGGIRNGQPTNSGSLTFDRWHQDQTIQMTSNEVGPRREAALIVNDHPDAPMDFAAAKTIAAMPAGPARDAAVKTGHYDFAQRVYLGRRPDGTSQLLLRDAGGHPRLRLGVTADGESAIEFMTADGRVTHRFP